MAEKKSRKTAKSGGATTMASVSNKTDTKGGHVVSDDQKVGDATDTDLRGNGDSHSKLKCVHEISSSYFASTSGFENYRGFLNLCILLMVLSNFRVALDNILKYGVLVDPTILLTFFGDPYSWPSATLFILSNVFIQFTYFIERLLSKGVLTERVGLLLQVINLVALLVTPTVVIIIVQPMPVAATFCCSWYLSVFLKLISYVAINYWCREEIAENKKNDKVRNIKECDDQQLVCYPDNLNQKDLYYFMFAPTYCYEINFPRSPRIRYRFLTRRIFEMLFLIGVMIAITQQWIVPAVKNSMKPFQEMDYPRFLERIMKLAVPNHLLWLMFFYVIFHSFLNIVAELLRFGDRTFYRDWWNANTVQYFWQNWNIPIHRWAHRHLYKPMLRMGFTKISAGIAVFLISAFFHEFLVSVPLRMVKLWAFMGMIMQIPLSIFVSKFLSGNYGNLVVWLSLILGQPIAILMYYHDYFVTHYQEFR